MSYSFQRAALYNDEGIAALIKGDEAAAIAGMIKAMGILKACSSCGSTTSRGKQWFGGRENNRTQELRITTTTTIKIPTLESFDSIAFDQAVRLPSDLVEPSDDDITLYLAVVIFNMALALHHAAAASESISRTMKMMTKAEKLYAMVSRRLLNDCTFFGTCSHTVLLVKLACVGNLTQIYNSRGDYKGASRDRRQVLSWFTSTSTRQSSLLNQKILVDPKIQSVILLILLVQSPVVAGAA
mmetsp:Transcript_123860/g.185125  ORF Transcript_123860/g.185125 Transcript_123860/m.185125 type:complete len:241 (+) Transcript_123860:63-785(+)